jgi:hypothetical protein
MPMRPQYRLFRSHVVSDSWWKPQTVEHVGIYADLSVGLRLGLVSLYVVLPRLRRGVALMEKS